MRARGPRVSSGGNGWKQGCPTFARNRALLRSEERLRCRVAQSPADRDGLLSLPLDEVDFTTIGEGRSSAPLGLSIASDEQVHGESTLLVLP